MKRPSSENKGEWPTATPTLRFPEFRRAPAWTSKELSSIADPVSERADNEAQHNILTLSSEHGLVLQSEYFGKQVAGASSDRYLRIQRDDFVYNDRTTKASEYGTIKRLKHHPHGIVSPIYKCFRFKEGENPSFWEWYFESGTHEAQLRSLANEGARAGRFNVSIDRFLSTSVLAPDSDSGEEEKVAECLSTLDELIGAESQKLDALKAHKKGLMRQLFPREGETLPRLRFPEFHAAPGWAVKPLGLHFEEFREKSTVQDEHEVLTSSRNGLVRQRDYYDNDRITERDNIGFNVIPPGFITYRSRSDDRTFYFNENDLGITGIVSVYYPVFRIVDGANKFFIELLSSFSRLVGKYSVGTSQTVLSLKQLGRLKLPVPSSEEQHRIAACLASIDDLILAEEAQLKKLVAHKNGLMQQLFPSPDEAEG